MKDIYIEIDGKMVKNPKKLKLPKGKEHVSFIGYVVEDLDEPITG